MRTRLPDESSPLLSKNNDDTVMKVGQQRSGCTKQLSGHASSTNEGRRVGRCFNTALMVVRIFSTVSCMLTIVVLLPGSCVQFMDSIFGSDYSGRTQSMLQSIFYHPLVRYHHHHHVIYHHHREPYDGTPLCNNDPCFQPPTPESDTPQVPTNRPNFPSFWNYATGRDPIDVTFDKRSILINGDRALFIGGSMHPSRATPETWEKALDLAVDNGLNLITVYIIWAAHQPTTNSSLDFNLTPKPIGQSPPEWSIASSIRSAAKRGLFVHIRIGPYVCAEYNYGGIPEWVPLSDPDMSMRRPNRAWMKVMERYITATVSYLQENRLFANQGGPIVMAQIENELRGEVDESVENLEEVTIDGSFSDDDVNYINDDDDDASNNGLIWKKFSSSRHLYHHHGDYEFRTAKLQDYADWCGLLANSVAPNVVWTMCSGLSADNTINTYNGQFYDTQWLEDGGDSGRVQVDHPAIWTEHEGGFQIWGDESNHPSDYFWGETASSMAYSALRWFARGGSHVNYYMWWGGYNRERSAAAGIMNMYASDAVLCPSGEPRQPKYDHFTSLANVIAKIAPVLLHSDSALNRGERLYVKDRRGYWVKGDDQRAFRYHSVTDDRSRDIIFVENASRSSQIVKVEIARKWSRWDGYDKIYEMQPFSALVIVDGDVWFDSSNINSVSMSYTRHYDNDPVGLQDWVSAKEPIGASTRDQLSQNSRSPLEQTSLNVKFNLSSDYAWYETEFQPNDDIDWGTLQIEAQYANAFLIYLDNQFVGQAETHEHREGDVSLRVQIGRINSGYHRLSILSESLGNHNLIGGTKGATTAAKQKGITGRVSIKSDDGRYIDLTDGRLWRSYPSLHVQKSVSVTRNDILQSDYFGATWDGPTWTSAIFDTPNFDATNEALFLDISLGRGHLWLNGNDLGRYWNITRGETSTFSQRSYFLPNDYLFHDGQQNEIVLFDVFGNEFQGNVNLFISSMEISSTSHLKDEVDFPGACV